MTKSKAPRSTKPSLAVVAIPVVPAETTQTPAFRIVGVGVGVGVGASAGGLDAFEQLFQSVPLDNKLAFVLVPHLDPGHASILTEILQRSTAMPVIEAQDQMVVAPGTVYVIPPNREMAMFHGTLQLSVPDKPHGQRMPIDAFLHSLAEDQGENAVCIILSGTGTDGTLGLRAIVGAGGVSLVQEPATAKYDGMPVSAIRAGYATHVLPVERMPAALLAPTLQPPPVATDPKVPGTLNRILLVLRPATGHDFSLYKKSTVGRRIERRMAQHDIQDLEGYARFLKENPAEIQSLIKELLINVTSFFRDPEAFEVLKRDILPQILAGKPEGYVLRIWVAGCASGEEAYSIAIALREFLGDNPQDFRIQLFATNLDEDAIALARAGRYPPNIAADLTPEYMRRWFTKEDDGYRVQKEIRELVVFAIQNVIKDPPFTKLDLLSCRNLMIYLEPELQDRLTPAFHYALKPDGVLFLSSSESIGNHPELFAAIDRKWKFYRAVHSVASACAAIARSLSWSAMTVNKVPEEAMKVGRETNFAELTRRALLQSYAPASVVCDAKGNILYVHGEIGKYLRPASGQATLNVVDMARENLQLELRAALNAAAGHGTLTLGREVPASSGSDAQAVSLSVRPLADHDAGEGLLLVSLQDLKPPEPTKPARSKRTTASAETRRIDELERDLVYTKENLQATIEEQQASNEELQSVNEELITVNAELQAKIEQLAGIQNDMKNLLDNINTGTIFLDQNLVIRRFTREAARVYRLVASDVGRPLGDIKSDFEAEDLLAEAQVVFDTLAPCERELRTVDGAWYQARIQPYRTLENVVDGVVLTFTEVSARVEVEARVQTARLLAESLIDTVREPLVVLDEDMKVISAGRSFYQRFRIAPEDTVGRRLYDLGNGQWDHPALHELLENILPRDQAFEGYVVEHDFPVIGRYRMLLNARRIVGAAGQAPLILVAMEEQRLA